jgi:hypothetical protein
MRIRIIFPDKFRLFEKSLKKWRKFAAAPFFNGILYGKKIEFGILGGYI